MNRRRVLAGIAGLGITGGGAWVAAHGLSGSGGLPMTVETMDAPGSSAGHVRIPERGTVTVIDLFATWCAPCRKQVAALAAVHGEYDDVAFVSVTNERVGGTLTRADIRDWWREHDGAWTLGLDPESDLLSALGASGLPYIALANADGEVVWTHSGVASADTLRAKIDGVRG